MFDLDEEMERMQAMLDRRERMALGVTCTEVIELITRLREAEMDAARYRFMRDSGRFLESGDDFDAAIDQAMKEKGDER